MKKFIKNLIIIVYAIIAIFVTICLLSYNEHRVTELGDFSLIIVDNEEVFPNYNKGDLIIVEGGKKIEVGDEVFFYNTYEKDITISYTTITDQEVITKTETTYTLEGDRSLSSEYVIGSSKNATVIPVVGTILGILESKWGFLILVVFPSLIAFLHELWEIIAEVRNNSSKSTKKQSSREE